MKGTLQGDFSRFPFDRKKRYSAVRMQQGRVQLDSDWNEQADILSDRIRTETADLIGPSGSPAPGGFEVTPGRHGLELGEQHFVQIGEPGFKGFLLPEGAGGEHGATLEVQVLPRGSGQIFGCWTRRGKEVKWKPVYTLVLDGGVLRLQRANVSGLAAEERWDLHGRLHHIAVTWGPEGTAMFLDGEPLAADEIGFSVPSGPTLLIVGSNQKPAFTGVLCELRLWRGSRSAVDLARDRDRRLDGDEPGLLGLWRFDEVEGGTIADRSPSGNDAHVSGAGPPPRRLPVDFHIGAGRYYVDGILCENPESATLTGQPDLPGVLVPQPRGFEREQHVLYLDVWERSITAVEDPGIRETALGGPDTATRSRVVVQVRCVRGDASSDLEIDQEWPRLIAPELARGRLQARRRPLAAQRLDNLLYRIEVHDAGDGRDAAVQPLGPGETRVLTLEQWDDRDGGWRRGQAVELFHDGAAPQDPPRHLARVTAIDPDKHTLTLDTAPGPAFRTKVELRVRRIATFKWSRNNGSLVFPIQKMDASGGAKLLPSPRGTQGLQEKDWVEVVDDHLALRQGAEPLSRIDRVDPLTHHASLSPKPAAGIGTDPALHPFLRLWDQKGEGTTTWGTVPATGGDWQEIEAGIEVRFAYDAPYRTGDYWWITARTLSPEIDWPRDAQGAPRLLPPYGVERRTAPLALLIYDADGYRLTDLRRIFQPFSEGTVSKAGDTMRGNLNLQANLKVGGDLDVKGQANLGAIYGRLHSHDAVHTAQLANGAVTPEKLSSTVGVVPEGHAILGSTPEAPEGYAASGWAVTLLHEDPRWVDRRPMPGGPPGPLVSAAAGGKVYIFLESGVVWEYDPESNGWQRRKDMPLPVRGFAVAALAGKIHVAGGLEPTGRCSARHFEYDPAADAWTAQGDLLTARTALALAACRGRLHALGGVRDSPSGKCVTARHEAYDPMTGIWSRQQPLPRRVCSLGAATVGDRINIAGGELRAFQGRGRRILTDEHHQYHAAADRWILGKASLPVPRRNVGLVEVYGRLYAVGGEGALGWVTDFEAYDPATDTWLAQPPLHEPVDFPGVAALDGAVYVTGALRAGAALVEECKVALRLHLHRRSTGKMAVSTSAVPERPALRSGEDEAGWEDLDLG